MSCKAKLKRHKHIPVVHVSGDVAGSDSAIVSEKILSLPAKKAEKVVVDLTEATFLDSHGLGVLVYAWKMLEEQERELVFLSPPPSVQSIFNGTNLGNVFRVINSLEEL